MKEIRRFESNTTLTLGELLYALNQLNKESKVELDIKRLTIYEGSLNLGTNYSKGVITGECVKMLEELIGTSVESIEGDKVVITEDIPLSITENSKGYGVGVVEESEGRVELKRY